MEDGVKMVGCRDGMGGEIDKKMLTLMTINIHIYISVLCGQVSFVFYFKCSHKVYRKARKHSHIYTMASVCKPGCNMGPLKI